MNATDTDDADHEGASVISMIIWNTSMTWVVMTNELGKYFLSYTWLFDWYGGKFIQQSTKMIEKSHLSFSGSSFCKKNSCLIVHFITVDCDGFLFHLPMLIQCSCNSWLSGSGSFAMVDSVVLPESEWRWPMNYRVQISCSIVYTLFIIWNPLIARHVSSLYIEILFYSCLIVIFCIVCASVVEDATYIFNCLYAR